MESSEVYNDPEAWNKPPKTWEELSPLERQIKVEEGILEQMLKGLKKQKDNIYSRILIRLIESELKEPRL